MKKKLFLLISALILAISLFALSSCNKDSDSGSSNNTETTVTYSLEGTLPNAVFGEALDLSSLSIKRTEGSSVTSIPVTSDMIISGGTYGTGIQSIVLAYDGNQFTTTVLVQYRVTFMDGDEILKVQYVTSSDEIVPPTVNSIEGMKFSGWEPDVNAPLSDNVTFKAVYNHVIPTPETTYGATYGDTLSTISLPSTVLGQWKFDLPETETVGNVGSNTFGISFVILGGEAIATDTVTIEVEKKELTFNNLVTEFTYNGQRQIPTYDFGGIEIAKENIFFINDGRSNYTDAGTYTYEFVINDTNYSGSASGTYTINKAPVTVTIESTTMSIIDTIPEISYTVKGFDFLPESELGLSLSIPEEIKAGTTYEIGATATNQNVILTVVPGTLSVTKVIPNVNDVRYPVFIIRNITYDANNTPSKFVLPAIYGDKFEDFAFESNPNGTWSFGEKTGLIGDASENPYLYELVFIHNDERYDPLVIEIPVKVNKKQLNFEISDTSVVYNGEAQGFAYEIVDSDGKVYTGLNVVNYQKYTDVKIVNGEVGEYEITISLDEKNYEAQKTVHFKINQAVPVTDFTTVYEAYWSDTLSDIVLPDGYSWSNPLTVLGRVNEIGDSFSATYTPADTNNYATIEGSFTVKTLHAPTYITVDERFETTYNGLEYIFNVSANRDKDKVKKAYYYLGTDTPVDPDKIANAGEYKVVFSLEQNEYYASATAECVLIINQATNTDRVTAAQSAVYGDLVKDKLTLPGADWKWYLNGAELGTDATVGTAGTHIYVAKYTDPNGNYADREAEITVTVAKQEVKLPIISNHRYNGEKYVPTVSGDNFTVIENAGGINTGEYSVTLKLNDKANFKWATTDNETITITYKISVAVNNWEEDPTASNSVFGEALNVSAKAEFGGVKIEYALFGTDSYSEAAPTNAGTYSVRFTTTDTNYETLTEILTFSITPKEITPPTLNLSTFVYNSSVQKPTIALNGEAYTVVYSNENSKTVGTYTITVTLNASGNYAWVGGANDVINFTYTITKANASIIGFTANGWTGWTYKQYDASPIPSGATTNFGTIVYTFHDKDGNLLSARPEDVGAYSVKATVAGTDNYNGDTETLTFTISKAELTLSGYSLNQFSGVVYQNDLDLSIKSAFKAEYIYTGPGGNKVTENVSGTFAYTKVVFAGAESYVYLTFTPASNNYYANSVKFDLTLKPVAILKTADGSVEYGTIENALSDAISGDEVWAIPCTDDSGNVETVVIKSDVVIKSGVTLVISWGIDNSSRNLFSDDGLIYATVTDDGDDNVDVNKIDGLSELKKLASVKLEAGKTITNHGTIEISGELGAPGGGVNYTGHTARNYAELLLGAGAQIISKKNSSIICCGFLYEEGLNNGSSVIIESGAVIYEPFVLRDWRGGTYTSFIYSDITGGKAVLFNMFEIINVTSRLTVYNGGEVKALANIFAGDKMNAVMPTVIGTVNDAIIQLNTDKSYVTAKYNPETHKCDLDIYGGAQTNGMIFRVDTGTLGVREINSSVSYFPISYFFDISLNDNGNNSVYYMNQAFKILTGGKLTVGENVTLIAKKIMLYEEFTDECVIPGKYPAGLPAGELDLYGTLIIETLGGIVTAKSNDARIIISAAASSLAYESTTYATLMGYNIGMNHKEIKVTAKLKSMNGEIIDISASGYGLGSYYVENGTWTMLTVSFNSNGGSSASSVHVNGENYPSLPTVTREGYTFLGWYYNGQLVQNGDAIATWKSHELVAEWKWLIPIRLDENGDGTAESTLYVDPDNASYPTLPAPVKEGFEFLGWYYGDTEIESGMALKSGDAHTLTALWQTYYKITFDSTSDVLYVDPDNAVYPTLPTPVKEGFEFLGWYYGDTKIEGGSLATNAHHQLIAKWQRYYSITFDSVSDVFYIDPDNAVYPTLPTPVNAGSEFLGWYFEGVLIESGAALSVEGDHKLVAKWKVLIPITLDPNGGTVSDSAVYFDSEGSLTYPALPTPTREGYKFLGWRHVDTNEIAEEGKALLVEGEHTLVAEWELLSYTLNLGTISNASVTVTVNGEAVSSGASIPYGSVVSISVTYNKSNDKTLTVKNNATNSNIYSGNATSYEFSMPAGNVTITASSKDPSCVTPDTLVTLADGTQVRIDSLSGTEELLVWNFYTGEYTTAPASILMNHGYDYVNVLTLYFRDGTVINTINGHGFFDTEANKFVIIRESNVDEFIGRSFVKQNENGYSTTELIGYSVSYKYTEVWSVLTAVHYNCVLEGLWTVTEAEVPNSADYLMPFDITEDMKYDDASMKEDIEKYGLYTYEDFEAYCSYEIFEALKLENFKVSVAKGYITFDEILFLLSIHTN